GFAPVPLPEEWSEQSLMGMGLAQDKRHVYAAIGSSDWLVMDRDSLDIKGLHGLDSCWGVHSVSLHGRTLTVLSTGSDEIQQYELDGAGRPGAGTVWWRPEPDAPRHDGHHINGICPRPGRDGFIISGLEWEGQFTDRYRRDYTNGFVALVPEGEMLAEGLWYPHTPVLLDDGLAWCESMTGVVHMPGRGVIRTGAAFVRGLCQVDDLLLVGTSGVRGRVPRNLGLQARCSVIAYHAKTWEQLWQIDLGAWGAEVSELMPLA
ncbi:MAG: DUF4915 domain-containing protein, partial [Thermomicrobiales bacterium]